MNDVNYLGTVLLRNLEGTFASDELTEFINREGNVNLAHAKALEVEAARVAFQFSAGDVSSNKLEYYKHLKDTARQIRADAATYSSTVSSMVSWSGSAEFGTAEVEKFIDLEYGKPDW